MTDIKCLYDEWLQDATMEELAKCTAMSEALPDVSLYDRHEAFGFFGALMFVKRNPEILEKIDG